MLALTGRQETVSALGDFRLILGWNPVLEWTEIEKFPDEKEQERSHCFFWGAAAPEPPALPFH